MGRSLKMFFNIIKLCVIALGFFNVTSAQEPKIDSSAMRLLRIDPSVAKGTPVSQLFEKVEYIPLETTKNSLFGEIGRLEVVDDKFVIYDFDTQSVLIFNSRGGYINKITPKDVADATELSGKAGVGNVFNSFSISNEDGVNCIVIFSNGSLFKYDLSGTLISKTKGGTLSPEYILSNTVKVIPDFTENKEIFYEFAWIKGNEAQLFFPFSLKRYEEDEFISASNRFDVAIDKGSIFYSNFYSYDIFELSGKGVFLKYRFILPQSIALPADFMNNPAYKAKRWEYLQNNKNTVYGIHNIVQMGEYLYFTLDAASQQISTKKTLAYNLKNNDLISIQHITPDASTFFLPVNDSAYGSNFLSRGFFAYDERSFYTSISSLSMFRFHSENKEGQNSYSANMKNYFDKSKPESNPVIVKVTPLIR